MIPPEAFFVVLRYGVSWVCVYIAHRGWVASEIPDDVVNGVTQIICGALGALGMLGWGLWRDRKKYIASIKALVHRGATIHAEPALAASLQLQGVPNVVSTPPANA